MGTYATVNLAFHTAAEFLLRVLLSLLLICVAFIVAMIPQRRVDLRAFTREVLCILYPQLTATTLFGFLVGLLAPCSSILV